MKRWYDKVRGWIDGWFGGPRISIPCGGPPVPLSSTKSFTATTYDLPFGKTGAQVRADAIADAEALKLASEDLNTQVASVDCVGPCRKIVGPISVVLVLPTTVVSSTGNWIYDTYSATATAVGTVTVQCN
jgi:hypothetical protein